MSPKSLTQAIDIKAVVVVDNTLGAFGKGATEAEAVKAMRRHGDPRAKALIVYYFEVPPDQLTLRGDVSFAVSWPKGTVAMRVEK